MSKLTVNRVVMIIMVFHLAGCGKKAGETGTVSLFNGKDFSGWYTWIARPDSSVEVPGMVRDAKGHYTEPIGLNKDPMGVFSVVEEDGAPAIRISGQIMGILVTDKEYENYHLKLQFKWGNKKYPPRQNEPRDSGILYNSIGHEGAWYGVWMKSIEYQVNEKEVGDIYAVDTVFIDIPAVKDSAGNYRYRQGAEKVTFSPAIQHCAHDADYEYPAGQWNTVEIYTINGRSVHVVNGKVNNRPENIRCYVNGEEVTLSKGKIQLQSEGSEVFYRDITIAPIREIPHELL